tara:strand:- start:12 stop:1007 length:996 start_codon:yes stop_codon:yes gene_type:complete
MGFKPDFISELPTPLQGPAGDAFELGRDYAEEYLKDRFGIGKPELFDRQTNATTYFDPHIGAQRKEQLLYIRHVASKKHIGLFAMLTSFSNNYTMNWNEEQVYGRPDPIVGYSNTRRSMTIGFKLVAADLKEAKYNYNKTLGRGGLERVSLTNMFYPTYKEVGNYKTIASPPIIAIKHMQLIQSYGEAVDGGYLVGYVGSSTITPQFDHGGYEDKNNGNFIYPKTIDISLSFNVLHDYDLGWKASTGFLAELFPELGSGEDIGRILGGESGGPLGAALGAIGGSVGDDIINSAVYDENEVPNDGATAGDAKSGGVLQVLLGAGIEATLGTK